MVRQEDNSERLVQTGGPSLLEWVCLAVAAITLIAFRLHAFDLPLETDEANYAYIGARLLDGQRLYVDLWDHQPFGIFVLFAGAIALFGDAPEVFRWLAMGFSLGSLWLLWSIARRCGGVLAGIVAVFLFAICSSDPGSAGEGCNREIFMNTFVLAAWFFAISPIRRAIARLERKRLIRRAIARPTETPRLRLGLHNKPLPYGHGSVNSNSPDSVITRRWPIFLAGLALGIGSTIKTLLAVHWIVLALWIAARARNESQERKWGSAFAAVMWFGAGPMLVWLISFVYFGMTDRLSEFVDAVFLFNLSYSDAAEPYFARFGRFFAPIRHPFIFDSALALWLGALVATVGLFVQRLRGTVTSQAWCAWLMVPACFVAVCLPGRFWPHYYYLLIPAAALVVAMGIGQLGGFARRGIDSPGDPRGLKSAARSDRATFDQRRGSTAARTGALVVAGALIAALLFTQYETYLAQPLFGITVMRYNSRDFWGKGIGEKVAQVTEPGDEIFVYGNDTAVYYYSGRRCASRFTMITGLSPDHPGYELRHTQLMSDLERRKPRLILLLGDQKPFPQFVSFLQTHYSNPIGWDLHDKTKERIMFVVARRGNPVETIDWNWDRSQVGGWIVGGAQ